MVGAEIAEMLAPLAKWGAILVLLAGAAYASVRGIKKSGAVERDRDALKEGEDARIQHESARRGRRDDARMDWRKRRLRRKTDRRNGQ